MKKNSWFFLLMILPFAGLTTCSKEEPISENQELGMAFFLTTDDINSITCANARSGGYIIDNVGRSGVITAMGVCWSTTPNPTTADNKTSDKFILRAFKQFRSTITGLNSGTTYYVRAYVTDIEGTVYGNELHFSTNLSLPAPVGSISDIDCNVYRTVQIGTQTWMAENLKTTRYNDGIQIPNVPYNYEWIALKTGAYRWYEDDAATFRNMYGALYNWYTVKAGKLCPTGWHVPSDAEWKQLEMTLGMTKYEADSWSGDYLDENGRGTDQGTQMKATSGWFDWDGKPGNGTNTSGFSALPGGDTWFEESVGAGNSTTWWTSTDYAVQEDNWWTPLENGIVRTLYSNAPGIIRGIYPADCGVSVRCLKD